MDNLGYKFRCLRESKGLLLRQVAATIEIDQALLSKIERCERIATRNQVVALANYFKVDKKQLLAIWLGEKIAYEIKDEEFAKEALKVAEKTIQYLKTVDKELANV